MSDWWEKNLKSYRKLGERDARNGMYALPYPDDDDPQSQDENHAYKTGWEGERAKLGDGFKWAQ